MNCGERQVRLSGISVPLAGILAVLLIISSGITYRVLTSRLELVIEKPIFLPIPLINVPAQIAGWAGKDVPIPANIQRVAGNDDFLNRLYVNEQNHQWANVYIAYSARPRTMLGHRPKICYVAGGWVHDSTEYTKLVSSLGRPMPCLVHRFHMPEPNYEERVVLNFYIVNGQITSEESVFSGLGWRTPNIAGNPARYVAQVQISSVLENPVRTAAEDMTELILNFFPDENGKVRAVENPTYSTSVIR